MSNFIDNSMNAMSSMQFLQHTPTLALNQPLKASKASTASTPSTQEADAALKQVLAPASLCVDSNHPDDIDHIHNTHDFDNNNANNDASDDRKHVIAPIMSIAETMRSTLSSLDNHTLKPFKVSVQAFEAYTDQPIETEFHAIPCTSIDDIDVESQEQIMDNNMDHIRRIRQHNTASFSRISSMLQFRMFGLGSGVLGSGVVSNDMC